MFGLLNLHKPTGVTSRDVVNQVQRIARPSKVGHAGTLDPLATGVLLVCVGPATRLIEYLQALPKTYLGTFLLGRHSPTEDVDSEVIPLDSPPRPTREQVASSLNGFVGTIPQVPPRFSALKIQGKRAYDLARRGKTVEMRARNVEIHGLELVEYDYPTLRLRIRCGSGTYVRSLGRDVARSLGTEAVMSELFREAIGPFQVREAIRADSLDRENLVSRLIPAVEAVGRLPRVVLEQPDRSRLAHGHGVQFDNPGDVEEVAAVSSEGRLVAILRRRADGTWGPIRNFPE